MRRRWILGFLLMAWCIPATKGGGVGEGRGGGRSLLGFRETQGNASFQCSPSGPCLPCLYSEKNDEKYHCSETGYRVPLKCEEIQDSSKAETSNNKNQRRLSSYHDHVTDAIVHKRLLAAIRRIKRRNLMDDLSKSEHGKQSYITYRSCVPADGEEKLSVLGFEMIMVCMLLVSGTFVYLRQKRASVMPGVGAMRLPTSAPRF